MMTRSATGQDSAFPRGADREIAPLNLWGDETPILKAIIALSVISLALIAAVSLQLHGTPAWPQIAAVGAILVGALLCLALAKSGRRDTAAVLLIGVLWLTATIFCFKSGYGLHSAAVFVYFPCVLLSALFFGVTLASVELALTIVVLVLMYVSEERGQIGGATAFVADGTNFIFLIGVIATLAGALAAGVIYHRRVDREGARVLVEAQRRSLAMEHAQQAQAQLQTALAKLQHLNSELAARDVSREREIARARRDLDLYHDVVEKDFPVSLRALRQAIASPDDQTESCLEREIGRMEAVVGALEELGRQGQPELKRARVDLSALALEAVQQLRAKRELAKVRFDIDAGLYALGDQRLLAALLRHLIKRAAHACRAEPNAVVHFGSGSLDGRGGFFVHDNGPGMDAARREKLFRPFGRDGAQDDTVDIGVVSARRIMERHGGILVIDSAPGKGTAAFFSLPGA